MSATDWNGLLDSMQRRLEAIEAMFASDSHVTVEPFQLPDGIGPLPKELRYRAERLLSETVEVEIRLERLMSATARRLHALSGAKAFDVGRPAPTYVDQSA
ncbi:MAG: hypothetical protein ACP5P1_09025 [Acidimicrobiales bacterium]